MALGDRIFIGGNSNVTHGAGQAHAGEILEGTEFVLTTASVGPYGCSRDCRQFKVINRGRDLQTNPITLNLPDTTTVTGTTTTTFILDLNNTKYSFYSVETTAGVIDWFWQAQELKEGT